MNRPRRLARARVRALTTNRIRAAYGRHSTRTWLLWALGAAVLGTAAAGLGDPGLWILLLDPEFVAVTALIGLALLRENGRAALVYLLALRRAGSDVAHRLAQRGRRRRVRARREQIPGRVRIDGPGGVGHAGGVAEVGVDEAAVVVAVGVRRTV